MKVAHKILMSVLLVLFILAATLFKGSSSAVSKQDIPVMKSEDKIEKNDQVPARQRVITQDLRDQLKGAGRDDWIPVTILMEDQIDPIVVERLVVGKNRKERRRIVIHELKRLATESQKEILEFLYEQDNAGEVKDLQSLWISNMISGKMKKGTIEIAAVMSGIKMIEKERYDRIVDVQKNEGDIPRIASIQWNITKIDAPCAWSQGFTGQGIIVGDIDTGVNYNHWDLADHVWRNDDEFFGSPGIDDDGNGYIDDIFGYDFINNDGNPMDDNGHGTHTAGTVAGDGTAGDSVGVAPDAQIMSIKVCTVFGSCPSSAQLAGVQYALDNGASVVTLSIGGGPGSVSSSARFAYNNALLAGMIATIAAGNSGSGTNTVTSPGSTPPPWLHPDQTLIGGVSGVITVGATNISDGIAGFSGRGPVTWQNASPWFDYPWPSDMGLLDPDVSAPGVNVTSLRYNNNSGYVGGWNGTSMATPHVAGLIALMLSKNPMLTPAELDSIIETTSVDLGTPGKDNAYGAGRIDACGAINAVPAPANPYLRMIAYAASDTLGNGDGRPDPSETIVVTVTLENHPVFLDATNVQAVLTSPDTTLTMVDSTASLPDIPAGNTGDNNGDPFTFTVNPGIIPHWATLVVSFSADPNGFSGSDSFTIRVGRPDILVVDDDDDALLEVFYTDPLDNLQVNYDLWNVTTLGNPGTEIDLYSCVIWLTGNDATTTLTPQDETDLANFLDGGGNLFISGQNIGEDIGANPFYSNYLKASFLMGNADDNVLSGVTGDEITDGMNVVIQGGNGAGNANSEDKISPLPGADSIITYTNAFGAGALKYDSGTFRVVYFAFPFEAIHGAGAYASRDTVMSRVLDWFCATGVGVEEDDPNYQLPVINHQFQLFQNLPNPFHRGTNIRFSLPEKSHVSLTIHDVAGRTVETLVNGELSSGIHEVDWNTDVPSGIYFYRLNTPNSSASRKLVILR
jgi:serine protease AprX